jgi:hypothetical protein
VCFLMILLLRLIPRMPDVGGVADIAGMEVA